MVARLRGVLVAFGPVAASVVTELRCGLPASVLVGWSDVWLLHSPAGCGLHDGVWGLVLAALTAMDFGRRAHIAMAFEASSLGAVLNNDQTLVTDFFRVLNQDAAGLPALSITERT